MSLPLQMFRRKSIHNSTRPKISWPVDSNRPDAPPPPPLPQPPKILAEPKVPDGPVHEYPTVLPSYPYHAYTTSESTTSSASTAPTFASSNAEQNRPSSDYSTPSHSPIRDRYCTDDSCQTGTASSFSFDLSAYFSHFPDSSFDGIDSDKAPPPEKWISAGDLPIYDSEGTSRAFKTLYTGPDAIGDRQLIIFVRHFFCGACQAYLRALSKSITLETYFRLATPASITIVGLGDPRLIPEYRRRTGCPFPIYTDPTKELYRALGMGWTLKTGKRVEYMGGVSEFQWVAGQLRQVRETERHLRFKGGNWLWVGGEFMVEGGEVRWCRRMRNYRGHSDVEIVRKLLGVED